MTKNLITTTNYEWLGQFMDMAKGRDWIDNIPQLTKDNIATVGNAILDYQPARDMFYNEFIVKIKKQLFGGLTANNKFSFLKGERISGDIEDSYVDYIKGSNFDPENETLLKNVKAQIKTLYHRIDRKLLYETSISDVQLRNAMLSSNGLDSLFGRILDTLYNSNEWDEFTMFKEMIVENFKHAGHVVYLGDPKTSEGTTDWQKLSEAMLFNLRKISKKLTYVSRDYNKLKLASATPLSEQVLIMQADMNLNIDFSSLASIFNLDKVETATNMIEVDNFNDNNTIVGAIMTRGAFRYHDELRTTETFRNGQTLTTKYMYHVWEMISYSYLYNTVYFVIGEKPAGK